MNKKVIIIVLAVTVVILGIITAIILSRRPATAPISNNATPISPTAALNYGLDIVSVSPSDKTSGITMSRMPIEITFSMPITESDIQFLITPDILYSKSIKGNKLIITPGEDYQSGIVYSYRVRILNDINKIRLYTFSTAGSASPYLPDTAPKPEEIAAYHESERNNNPDIYLKNRTPYKTSTFEVTSKFSNKSPSHFEFKVLLTSPDKNAARSDFLRWLQSLKFTDEQIQSLDIIYE